MAKRILIIEDEPDQVTMLTVRLQANGYEVLSAADGVEGMRMVHEERPDLILLDIVIPGIDGFEVCNRIKQSEELKSIPIIVISAHGARTLEENCLALGANDCVRKPYDSADLVQKIKALIGE